MATGKVKQMQHNDFVFENGKFIGEFEAMYANIEDPWNQMGRSHTSEESLCINWLKRYSRTRVLEIGCGLGRFVKCIHDAGIDVLGTDISSTAVSKASVLYPQCQFQTADILQFDLIKAYAPDCILMSDITWYVLSQLDSFLSFYKSELSTTMLFHFLSIPKPGTQRHGLDKFTNLQEIKTYFGLRYDEWGELATREYDGAKLSFFVGAPEQF